LKILVLVSDTFRADNLKIYGGKKVRTPALDRFAEESVVFTNCYTGSFPTVPHRQDCFTGLFTAFNPQKWTLSFRKNIAQLFREAGYVTQIISDTKTMMGSLFDSIRKSFDGYLWIRGQEGDMPLTKYNYLDEINLPKEKFRYAGFHFGKKLPELHAIINRHWIWEEDRFCVKVARKASQWLEENYKVDNFLLWRDFFDPHESWDPPEYLVRRYQKEYHGNPMFHPNYGRADRYDPDELENLRAHYFGEVELVDKWVGYVLRKLDDVGLTDDTVVIFTSDHGTLIGEHNWTGKSNYDGWWLRSKDEGWDKRAMPLYMELAHIPLMIRGSDFKAKCCKELTQPVDLFPTLLDLAGRPIPSNLHGYSLMPLLLGESVKWPRKIAVSMGMGSHGVFQPYSNIRAFSKEKIGCNIQGPAIRDGDWTLFLHGEQYVPELYKTSVDLKEENNLILTERDQAVELYDQFMIWLNEIGADEKIIKWAQTKSPRRIP